MKSGIKTTFRLFIATLLILGSCKGKDVVERTPEMERKEIDAVIAQYEEGGLNVDTTELGSYYIIFEEGTGNTAVEGDSVYLIYTGYLLTGLVFDASYNYYNDSIWKFVYKNEALITGFDEAISLMNKGTKMDIIIPSDLAYGDGTYAPAVIGEYRPLLFSMELRDLNPSREEQQP